MKPATRFLAVFAFVTASCAAPDYPDSQTKRGFIASESVSSALNQVEVTGPVVFKWGGVWSLQYQSFTLIDGSGRSVGYYLKSDPMKTSPTILALGGIAPRPVRIDAPGNWRCARTGSPDFGS